MTIEHGRAVNLICTRANGVQPLRQIAGIPDGYAKNRSQIWRLSVKRAYDFFYAGLIVFDHRPGRGIFGSGSVRTKSKVWPCDATKRYVEVCREAARLSNLSWPEHPYGDHNDTGYVTWQNEWLERRDRFRAAMIEIGAPK